MSRALAVFFALWLVWLLLAVSAAVVLSNAGDARAWMAWDMTGALVIAGPLALVLFGLAVAVNRAGGWRRRVAGTTASRSRMGTPVAHGSRRRHQVHHHTKREGA